MDVGGRKGKRFVAFISFCSVSKIRRGMIERKIDQIWESGFALCPRDLSHSIDVNCGVCKSITFENRTSTILLFKLSLPVQRPANPHQFSTPSFSPSSRKQKSRTPSYPNQASHITYHINPRYARRELLPGQKQTHQSILNIFTASQFPFSKTSV